MLSSVESIINSETRCFADVFLLLQNIDSCNVQTIDPLQDERFSQIFSLSRRFELWKSKFKFRARSFRTAAPLLTLITRRTGSRCNDTNECMMLQNDGGMLPSSTTYTGGLGSVVGNHGGHHVRRSLPDMGTAPSEPPKLYPYHLLVITNYRLPADVDRCNLEVSCKIVAIIVARSKNLELTFFYKNVK